jgi:hypothetical protein
MRNVQGSCQASGGRSPHHLILVHDVVRHAVDVLPLAGHDGDPSLPCNALHVLFALHRGRRVHAEHLQQHVEGMCV